MGIFKNKKHEETNTRASVKMGNFSNEYAGVYFVKLLFPKEVSIDHELLYEKLKDKFHRVDIAMKDSSLSSYALLDHMGTYKDEAQVASQLMITDVIPFKTTTISQMALQQCWTCSNVEALLNECEFELMVSDFMAGGLPSLERYQILAEFIDVLLSIFPQCIAMYWPHAEKLIPIESYMNSGWNDPTLHFLDGGLNVRFFKIQGSQDMLVDTTGLSALGLPDLQSRFHTLDPNDVVSYINNCAAYLFTNGDIIHDGESIDGRNAQEKWVCRHEESIVEPKRVVLDICMNEFASGNRRHE